MARVKRGVAAKKRHKKVLEQAKGYYGNKSRSFRAANEQVMRSGQYAFRDRRARKGEFRRLWIQRINAATRQHDMSLQPVHRRAQRRRHRGRPQDPRRSRRHRPRRVRPPGRAGQGASRRLSRERPAVSARSRSPTRDPTAAAPPGAPQCASEDGRLRRRGHRPDRAKRVAAGWDVEAPVRSRRASTPVDGAGPVRPLADRAWPSAITATETPHRVCWPVVRMPRPPATACSTTPSFVVVAAGSPTPATSARSCARPRPPASTPSCSRRARSTSFNPKVVRASAGALFHVPVRRGRRSSDVRGGRAPPGRHVVAPRDAPHRRRLDGPAGDRRRRRGPRPRRRRPVDEWVRIEHAGRAESLNVAMATTVLCFEVGPPGVTRIALCRASVAGPYRGGRARTARRRFRCPG